MIMYVDFQVAEPKLVFGSIKDWFEKQDSTSSLDTAASNLQFQVEDIHLHIGKDSNFFMFSC